LRVSLFDLYGICWAVMEIFSLRIFRKY